MIGQVLSLQLPLDRKNTGLEKQQKNPTYNVFYASKLQDYVEEGLLFQNVSKSKNYPCWPWSPIFSHNTKLGHATFVLFCDAGSHLGTSPKPLVVIMGGHKVSFQNIDYFVYSEVEMVNTSGVSDLLPSRWLYDLFVVINKWQKYVTSVECWCKVGFESGCIRWGDNIQTPRLISNCTFSAMRRMMPCFYIFFPSHKIMIMQYTMSLINNDWT